MQEAISAASTVTTDVSRETVEAELTRILSSRRFLKSEVLREFLRFIVTATLEGRGGNLKESVIAMEAFGRRSTFDPRLDASVRVQAGRLRAALSEYYQAEGRDSTIRIEVPKGSYSPLITRYEPAGAAVAEQPSRTAGKRRRRLWIFASILAVVLTAAGMLWTSDKLPFVHLSGRNSLAGRGALLVAGFENTSGDPVFDGTIRQALLMDLEQSPVIEPFSEQRVQEILQQMGHSAGDLGNPVIARELCQRAGGQAVLSGSISRVGQLYVIGMTATGCASGSVLVREQVRAESKEKVLQAVDRGARDLRRRLGESMASLRQYGIPFEQATTPSLKALQAYSEGVAARSLKGDSESIPFFQSAIEIDPDFAMAYAQLGAVYFNLVKNDQAAENFRKAFALRQRVSQHERYYIESRYYQFVTADEDKALALYENWSREFPLDPTPYLEAGIIDVTYGDYAGAAEQYRYAIRNDPNRSYFYTNLAQVLLCLNRPGEARSALEQMHRKDLHDIDEIMLGYQLAYLEGNAAWMRRQTDASAGQTEAEEILLLYQAFTAAGQNRMDEARRLIRQAMALAVSLKAPERAAAWQVQGALVEAEMGSPNLAIRQADAALGLSQDKEVRTLAALALARAGEVSRAQTLAKALRQQYPSDTILSGYWLPSIAAAVDLRLHKPDAAIEALAVANRFQSGQSSNFLILSIAPLYPVYLRGLAYQMAGMPAEAAVQFHLLADHPEWLVNHPLRALARQQLVHANAMPPGHDSPRR